ncbi:GGDEF domain-containing protein [Fibrobacter sp.]|uniref:GGDEF domain-containing protein n=1 Tax=Fibrobacter sp. TaxID=35828 RepID=UPI00386395E0
MDTQFTFADSAIALSLDYECVFFVDVENANYAMYAFHGNHKSLKLSESSDFWADTRVNLQTVVYEEDRQSFNDTVSKEYLIPAVQNDGVVLYKYRILVDGQPVWYSMKVVLGQSRGRSYLIIGVNNIDKQERERLALEHKASKSATYGQIVMALAERYDALYMVDLETDHYIQYKSERTFCELSIALEGDDFFNQLRKDALSVIYKDDVELITDALKRDVLLKELNEYGVFTLTYRLNTPQGPQYVKLVAVYSDKKHVVISVTNVDARMRREIELKKKASKSEVYGQIVMALAERYDALYMVDLDTNRYALYKAERVFSELSVALEGEDFFNQLQKDAETVIFKEDVPLIQAALHRETLLKELDEQGMFTVSYRLNSPTGPVFVSLVAVYSDKNHIVISITNIDAQVRREQKIREEASLAYEKARRDDLTGIKNKNAYGEFEKKLDQQIQSGEDVEFAIAICDVNGLKVVNDTQGHIAGDKYIRMASKLVCETFKHSPVFRVGGDEFVAILRGSDFARREKLQKDLSEIVTQNAKEGKVVVACGISVFDKKQDKSVSEVFERADAMMYKDKMSLKGGRDEIINTIIRTIGARTSV